MKSLLSVLCDASICAYVTLSAVLSFRLARLRHLPPTPELRLLLGFFGLLAANSLLLLAAHPLASDSLIAICAVIFMVLSLAFGLYCFRYPEFTFNVMAAGRQVRSPGLQMKEGEVEIAVERLRNLMEKRKAFHDPRLTLARLGSMVGVSSHQLSYILNTELGQSFPSYVNSYRLLEAERLLRQQPGMTVLQIAIAAGFNSRTTFNAAFLARNGMAPNQFRQSATARAAPPAREPVDG